MSLDPDVQAVFGSPGASQSYSDPDVNALFGAAPTWGGGAKFAGSEFLGGAEALAKAATGAVGSLGGGLTYLGTLAATRDPEAAQAVQQDTQNALTYQPRTKAGKEDAALIEKAVSYLGPREGEAAGPPVSDFVQSLGGSPAVAGAAGAAANTGIQALPMALGLRKGLAETPPALTPQQVVDRAVRASPQNAGAAATAPNIAAVSPTLQQAVVKAAQKNGGAINLDAYNNQAEAEKHGVQLMEGQATRDATTFSNEQNSTNPAIIKRRTDQEQQLVDALDNIRGNAGPTTVHNNPIENGQIVLDRLKTYDEPIKADIDAKYDAARAASASGDLQMDGSSFVDSANAALKPQSKFRFLPSAVQGILDDVKAANGRMTLDDYQAYDTQLGNEIAKAKRSGDGNAVFAIKQVKNALNAIQPVGEETAQAKALFDVARSAAKARFEALDLDPAYEAAVSDDTRIGAPSPLADKFLDKYALGAPKANLDLMMQKLDQEGQQAVASHTLSTMRNAAVTPNGTLSANGFNSAMRKFGPKLNSLVGNDTVDSLESLGRVITNAKVAPTANFVNYSKSGVLRNAATDTSNVLADTATELGGKVLNAKTFGIGVPIIKSIAERNFANRVLAPGAGIQKLSDLLNPGTNP